ncbi:MAG TPA: hypothetical protein VMI74_02080 [Burkholderiales bacterium]|nr:hypothetical protein [Burkholderiales bacterium]
MKDPRLAAFPFGLAALLAAGPAAASPAGDIAGTWECRLPGVQYNNKPPILYVADAGTDQVTIEVDGFSREIYGRSEVSAADQSGWWKVKPAQGQEFMIRPEGVSAKQKTAAMGLRFSDSKGDYRCLRLPESGAPAAAAPAAPAAESAPPASTEPAPAPAPSGEPPAAQPATPAEGAVKKDY